MRVIVVGAGQVGESIAADLENSHEVVVVDRDGEKTERLTYELDVLAIQGDGTSIETLEDAGIADADMVIATTDNDETNIVVCSTAKALGDAFTVARIKHTGYLSTWRRSGEAFGIDFMVGTNLLTAETIVRVIGLPAARDVDPFVGGRIQMAEFEIDGDSPVAGQTVREADRWDSLTFAAVLRNGSVEIPGGETVIRADDRVVVVGSPESVHAFARAVAPDEAAEAVEDVVIVGGGEIGYQTARLLEEREFRPRLIERDSGRARDLAEDLPHTVVLESDATDVAFLEREHVGDADVMITATDSDERNLLIALLAKRLGVDRTVAVIGTAEYVPLFETVGVDVGVSPREVVAEEITRFTRDRRAENVALIETDKAEVVEIEVDESSPFAGRSIRDAIADLPPGIVVGAITRGGEPITPRGDTVVETGDHVVVFAETEAAEALGDGL